MVFASGEQDNVHQRIESFPVEVTQFAQSNGKSGTCFASAVRYHFFPKFLDNLKYGFCKKSLRKNATLNSKRLFSSQGTCSTIQVPFWKKKVFNYSELHFSDVTFYKIHTLMLLFCVSDNVPLLSKYSKLPNNRLEPYNHIGGSFFRNW